MDQETRARFLGGCQLFVDLHTEELQDLAASATLRRYRKGQIVFSEGDKGDFLLVIVEGRLKAFSNSEMGHEFVLTVLGPGDSLGELAIADGGPRSATVAALRETTVLRLSTAAILTTAMSSPALMTALLTVLSTVVRRLTGTAADLVFLDLPRRVAKLLLAQRDATGTDLIDSPLTQEEMAQQVGSSRQSLNSALGAFHRRGWISITGGRIRIHDSSALKDYVSR